ncbi:MAG: L-seryl-tRNA(Sec) selenium transferase [Anaerolineaceae bacterium]|nr:L-seryl-tRNA(Sec) selenium transferase [Anaerolineaceae bacterium]
MPDLRSIPAVGRLLEEDTAKTLVGKYGRDLVVRAIRETIDRIRSGQGSEQTTNAETILHDVEIHLESWFTPTLRPVINATGVVIHTNLGRAPLSKSALQALVIAGGEYSTLEFNLNNGKRGNRSVHAEEQLKRLLGVEAALVVNNNAAAVLLCLSALARRRKVVISRTQLVEIGGGFRVPEVMSQSGAILYEIGTTNRVHLADYENALAEKPALIMRAHHSNYRIIGFTSEPALSDIVSTAHGQDIPVLDDLGSGALVDTSRYGLLHEPTVQESLEAGVDVVCFSGDKLLGGPQAGIIVGRKELLDKVKKHPLARAVRADKLCLAALSATLDHYLKGEAEDKVPVWQMIAKDEAGLKTTVEHWKLALGAGEVQPGRSAIGGGSLPEETLPTWVLQLTMENPDRFLSKLRRNSPPVIARIENETVILDARTIFPEQEEPLLAAIARVLH